MLWDWIVFLSPFIVTALFAFCMWAERHEPKPGRRPKRKNGPDNKT